MSLATVICRHLKNGRIDRLVSRKRKRKGKLLLGFSAYPRTLDYKRFKEICAPHNAILLSDMAHVTGLVAAELYANPFDYSDVVTCTTHKTLRGPR